MKISISCFSIEGIYWTIEHPLFTDNWRTVLGEDVIGSSQLSD